jgi:hypothetical protein
LSSSRRMKKGPGRRPQSAKRQRFVELRERGWSILAAAREVGVSRTTGNNWSRRLSDATSGPTTPTSPDEKIAMTFHETFPGSPGAQKYPTLCSPLTLPGRTIPNRIVSIPHATGWRHDGLVTPAEVDYHVRKAPAASDW